MISMLHLRRAALLARGMSHREIAEAEDVSEETVKSTFANLRVALDVRSSSSYASHLLTVLELQRRKLLIWDRDRQRLEPNFEMYRRSG